MNFKMIVLFDILAEHGGLLLGLVGPITSSKMRDDTDGTGVRIVHDGLTIGVAGTGAAAEDATAYKCMGIEPTDVSTVRTAFDRSKQIREKDERIWRL